MPTQEEVFSWFRNLSGAKRIEIMCGLMSMCIPLEIRYFETIVHDLAKKDYSSFRETEIKANSITDLDTICKCDLLSEKATTDFDESEINSNGNDATSSNGSNEPVNQKVNLFSNFPSRSKLIISLCLLQPTNHHCSSVTFNSLRQQLVIDNIMHAIYNLYIPKNQPLDNLFSEILLLLTMALYHPAFSYEQRDLLMKQKEDVEHFISAFSGQLIRSNALVSTSIQSPQQAPSVVNAPPGSVVSLDPSGPQSNQTASAPFSNQHHHHLQQQQQQQQQQHHSSPHPQPVSQTANTYHPSPYGSHHPTLIAGQMPTNVANKSHQQLTHIHPHQQPGPFPISFLPHPVPIANLTYSPQGQVAPPSNQSQAFLTNMSILRINSPISSTSPSPKSSPNYNNQFEPFVNDSNNTGGSAVSGAGGGGNNSGGVAVTNSGTQQIMYQSFDSNMGVAESSKSSSVSSNSNQLSSASCYNCGHLGHRGGECTSAGGDDNR